MLKRLFPYGFTDGESVYALYDGGGISTFAFRLERRLLVDREDLFERIDRLDLRDPADFSDDGWLRFPLLLGDFGKFKGAMPSRTLLVLETLLFGFSKSVLAESILL